MASGSGSNAEKIIEYLKNDPETEVSVVVTNKKNAGVIDRAAARSIPVKVIPNNVWGNEEEVLSFFRKAEIDLIVLAGFLRKIPEYLIRSFPEKIVNIHPALLPLYGGKGMYGMNVHKAVCENKEKESGITIHLIDEEYDRGKIIFQAKCTVLPEDSPEDVRHKVQQLEHQYYPLIVWYLAKGLVSGLQDIEMGEDRR